MEESAGEHVVIRVTCHFVWHAGEMASTGDQSGSTTYDLVIVGGSAGGISVAISSLRSGLERVRIIVKNKIYEQYTNDGK